MLEIFYRSKDSIELLLQIATIKMSIHFDWNAKPSLTIDKHNDKRFSHEISQHYQKSRKEFLHNIIYYLPKQRKERRGLSKKRLDMWQFMLN